jgi:hypothetical protein
MYTINKESIQPIVQKAYEEGRMLAQNVEEGDVDYFYRRGDIGCAIGVALPQDVADSLQQQEQLTGNSNKIGYDAWCMELQSLHDKWANCAADICIYDRETVATFEADFKAHLYS